MKMPPKLKMLPSTMRERKRYLLLKSPRSGKQGGKPAGGLQKKVETAILKYIGELGYAKAGPQFIFKGKHLILSISHEVLNDVRAALAMKKIECLGVSGTIEALMEKFGK